MATPQMENTKVPIYRLNPAQEELGSPDWRLSTYHLTVVVRAPSEHIARRAASIAFSIAAPRDSTLPIPANPWIQESLVRCTETPEAGWPANGPTEILEPPDCNEALTEIDWS